MKIYRSSILGQESFLYSGSLLYLELGLRIRTRRAIWEVCSLRLFSFVNSTSLISQRSIQR